MIQGLSPMFATDFYKTGHREQYPEGTEVVYSNFTCRSAKHAHALLGPAYDGEHVVWFGLQRVLQDLQQWWQRDFFEQPIEGLRAAYQHRLACSLGVTATFEQFEALHALGYLPLQVRSLPEGTLVPMRVPCFTIRNTHPQFAWLTNYVETYLSAEVWKPMTVATIAHAYRQLLDWHAARTGGAQAFVPWQGHDFSMRGMAGVADSAHCGMGHLLSFWGTDTIQAIELAARYYPGDPITYLFGGSVAATEHSVMCMGGELDEVQTFERLLRDVYPTGIVSIVSDTWDFWHVVTDVAQQLHALLLARAGKCVFRPDSGVPELILCGDPKAPAGSPARRGAVQCLWDVFGGTTNAQGLRTLDPHVGLIYGDSITLQRVQVIQHRLAKLGFASDNVVFGIGSFTYQHVTRDTFGTAIKATWGVVQGQARELFKAPKTDDGTKHSARGLLRVEREAGELVCHEQQTLAHEQQGLLRLVFCDGQLRNQESFGTVRRRLHPTWEGA